MLIVKELSGLVSFYEGGAMVKQLNAVCTMQANPKKGGVWVIDKAGREFFIDLGRVLQTQILPAAAVDFSGTVFDLWELLVNDFFEELHGTVIPPTPPTEETYLLTSGNYNIDFNYKNLINAANGSNFRLPTIAPAYYGKAVTVFAAGFTVNVICDDPAGDRITDKISITLKKYDAATFICFSPNLWLIR